MLGGAGAVGELGASWKMVDVAEGGCNPRTPSPTGAWRVGTPLVSGSARTTVEELPPVGVPSQASLSEEGLGSPSIGDLAPPLSSTSASPPTAISSLLGFGFRKIVSPVRSCSSKSSSVRRELVEVEVVEYRLAGSSAGVPAGVTAAGRDWKMLVSGLPPNRDVRDGGRLREREERGGGAGWVVVIC